jgi:hypothetical protein
MLARLALALLSGLALNAHIYNDANAASTSSTKGRKPINVTLVLGGTSYNGNPEFEVTADGLALGTGEVTAAAGQTFDFAIPPGANPRSISIAFTNDYFEAPDRDRNLVVKSIVVGGQPYAVQDVQLPDVGAHISHTIGGDSEIIISNATSVIVARPATGWTGKRN